MAEDGAAAALGAQRVVDGALDKIEANLQPLLAQPFKETTQKLTPIENARLHVTLGAEAMYKSYFCFISKELN